MQCLELGNILEQLQHRVGEFWLRKIVSRPRICLTDYYWQSEAGCPTSRRSDLIQQ